MPPYKIRESFSWLSPEFTYNDAPGNKVIIRGPALFSVEKHLGKGISQNQRRYVQEEIIRSARTLKGKYIDVNHEYSTWKASGIGSKPTLKGHVIFGEEENGIIEYIAEVNHREYAQKIRDTDKVRKGTMRESDYTSKWGKKPLIGVSVDADFVHYQCSECGDKFYDPDKYERHMINVEKVRNLQWEPHQIIFNGLSLVEPPEIPGVIGASFEIVECKNGGISQLLETVIKTAKEKETMTQTPKVPYKIKEQAETPPEDEKEDEEDEDKKKAEEIDANTGEQSEGEPQKLSCPEGYHLATDDNGNQTCEPDIPAPPMDNPTATEAADVEPMANAPVGDGATVTTSDSTACPVGQHRDPETDLCVADDALVEPAPNTNPAPTATETVKLPPFLRLGEPFAGYDSMDDCIAKNPDKDDPAAFCSSIMRKTEGEPASEVKETTDVKVIHETFATKVAEIANNGLVRDARTAGTVNRLIEAQAKTTTNINKTIAEQNKNIVEIYTKIVKYLQTVEKAANFNLLAETKKQAKETAKLHNSLVKQTNVIVEALNKNKKTFDTQIGEVKTSYNSLQEYTKSQLTSLATSIAETNKSINTIKEAMSQFDAKVTEQKTDFETILAQADKNATEMKNTIKSLEEWKKETEQKLTETKQQETEKNKLTEALEPLSNKIDNLEAKLRGNFKQQHTKTSDPEPIKDTPYEE